MIQDPVMLLSYINTKLRDEYDSFEALCEDLELSACEVEEKLNAHGFFYKKEQNKFV